MMTHDNVTEHTGIEIRAISEGRLKAVLAQLAEATADPVHKRLIAAYAGGAPLDAMVEEFGKVLREVVCGED